MRINSCYVNTKLTIKNLSKHLLNVQEMICDDCEIQSCKFIILSVMMSIRYNSSSKH